MTHLIAIQLEGKAEEDVARLIGGEVSVSSFAVSATGGVVAALVSAPCHPAEVFLLDKKEGLRQISHANDAVLAQCTLGRVEKVAYKCDDVRTYTTIGCRPTFIDSTNHEVETFVIYPPGFDASSGFKYPTLLWIHGGPVAQYDFAFATPAQLFAARGYVVLQVNPRGSTGRGEEFCAALYADWGGPALRDVLGAVDWAVDAGIADPARLCVGGWSYGGILTNHVITKDHRFVAAMTGASSVLYRASYGHDQYQLYWEQELGLPWENAAGWEAISPFNDVADVTTPTLIVCGEVDWNVPVQNSDQLYQALKRLGIDTQLVVYPAEHHGISLPSFERDRYERWFEWFDNYTGSK